MPRPKTELTYDQKVVGARITNEQFKVWRKLGGSVWLRDFLEKNKTLLQGKNDLHRH